MRTVIDVPEIRADKKDLPSKKRVWGFRAPARHRIRKSASQVAESRRENVPTPTTIVLGRWFYLQTDPLPPRSEEMNAYVYVTNDPTNLTDPSGQMAAGCIAMTVISLALPPGWVLCSVAAVVVVAGVVYYDIYARSDGSTEAPGKPTPPIIDPVDPSDPATHWALCYAACIARFGNSFCAKSACVAACTIATIWLR